MFENVNVARLQDRADRIATAKPRHRLETDAMQAADAEKRDYFGRITSKA
jgi:hypothetical protein